MANKEQIDPIILGNHISIGRGYLSLRQRVERILSNAPCPVLVINSG